MELELRNHVLEKIEADWRIVQENGLPECVWIGEYESLGSNDWPFFEEKGFIQAWRLDDTGLSLRTLEQFVNEGDRFKATHGIFPRLYQSGQAYFGMHKQKGFVTIAYTWGVRYAGGWKCEVENNKIIGQKMRWIS